MKTLLVAESAPPASSGAPVACPGLARRSFLGDTHGVILPASGDARAAPTLDVRLEALPPDCVGSRCQLRLYLFL